MRKPNVGEVIQILTQDIDHDAGKVLAVFDSFDEDWGVYGELSWLQRDADDTAGISGEWYVIVCNPDDENETYPLGSYEIAYV